MDKAAALPEVSRNRLLRRMDWRLLLQSPLPERATCLAGGDLAAATDLIAGTVARPGQGDCDLVVVADPSPAQLQRAWASLRPGGVVYGEWRRPRVRAAHHAIRQLERAGFVQVRCYWAWAPPHRAAPAFWLPLSAPWALRHLLRTRPLALARAARSRQRLERRLLQAAYRTGLLFPVSAIGWKQAAASSDDAGAAGSTEPGWWAGPATPSSDSEECKATAPLLLTGGRRSINKVVAMLPPSAPGGPSVVVKLPRVPESVSALGREARALESVNALGQPGVPHLLSYTDAGSATRLAQRVLPGLPLHLRLTRQNYPQIAQAAGDWLAELAHRSRAPASHEWRGRSAEPALAAFRREFGSIVESGDLTRTEAALDRLPALPSVFEQRDFAPWNVLIDGDGTLGVLDWESAEPRGLPALDLIYFLTYLAFFHDGAMANGNYRTSYLASLDPTTPTGRVTQGTLTAYCQGLGLDLAILPSLRLLTWMIHARSEYGHYMADAGGEPSPLALRKSLFVGLWQAELRAQTPSETLTGSVHTEARWLS